MDYFKSLLRSINAYDESCEIYEPVEREISSSFHLG